jgi:hypothetical protein
MYPMYLIEMKRNYLAPRYPYFIDNQNIRTNMRLELEVENEGIDVDIHLVPILRYASQASQVVLGGLTSPCRRSIVGHILLYLGFLPSIIIIAISIFTTAVVISLHIPRTFRGSLTIHISSGHIL